MAQVVYPYGYYGYPYPYAVPAPVYVAPPAVAVPAPVAPRSQSWYYCDNPKGYYPYVQKCAGAWREVPAQAH